VTKLQENSVLTSALQISKGVDVLKQISQTELVRLLKEKKVTNFSVNAKASDTSDDDIVMGGKIVCILKPLSLFTEDGTKFEDDTDLFSTLKDHTQFYTAEVDDGCGRFYVDLYKPAYGTFEDIFVKDALILVTGTCRIFTQKVKGKELEREIHVRAFNIERLSYDQQEPAII
jgi:hypothetical protein